MEVEIGYSLKINVVWPHEKDGQQKCVTEIRFRP